MFFCPYLTQYNYFRNKSNNSFIRILHASPDAPPVDIYLNNKPIIKGLSFKKFTNYLPVKSGNYNIKIFPSGEIRNPVINTNLFIPKNKIFTIAAIDKLNNIRLLPILEPKMNINKNKAYIRFAHLSPNSPSVDIRLPNGKTLFNDIKFEEISDYIAVNPTIYTLDVYLTKTDKRILRVPNVKLKPNRFYTVYAVGLYKGIPKLQVLIPLDGNSYIKNY